jgi:hypothetical protein
MFPKQTVDLRGGRKFFGKKNEKPPVWEAYRYRCLSPE